MGKNRTGILIILDGFGVNPSDSFNAITSAKTPVLDRIFKTFPHGTLEASEQNVGLPPGFMGNSEVGHLNIGAGRVVFQDFSLISRAIQDESFFENPSLSKVMTDLVAKPGKGGAKALHLMGLVSDGGVHSHLSHLLALVQMAKRNGLTKVYVHVFTDGRDTSPVSGVDFVKKLEDFLADSGVGQIATIEGRFFAMDRDNRWERTEKAYRAIVMGEGEKIRSAVDYVRAQYDQKTTDEFILPAVVRGYEGIEDGDGVIFFNFRADRARQLVRAMTDPEFVGFSRPNFPTLAGFVCMTPYHEEFKLPTAFEKPKVPNTIGEVLSKKGMKQLRIAETEKYAHVTYFFNGGDERVFDGEKRVLVPSPREVRTYDLKPEMSAKEVTEKLLGELKTGDYSFVVVNFANPDMVGHTGNFPAAVRAVETVDQCLGKILDWVESHDAFAVITADHGNCEKMMDDTGLPLTSHTLLPVPFLVVDKALPQKASIRPGGKLSDIAPTLLSLFGLETPREMTGKNLIAP